MSPLVISAWSATSPFGVGADPFRAGLEAGRSAVEPVDRETHPGPFEQAALVPEFTAARYVGKKGTRTMDRVTALAVTTVGGLVKDLTDELAAHPEQTGLVLGTGSGSVQSIMDFTRDSLVGERPYHVDPARFPNTVMNRAAGQGAIWHRIKGPNTTVAGGTLTGLLALSYAVRLLRGGHCGRVLCGAAEEYSTQRAWLEWHGRAEEERDTPLGEGSAVFLVESAEAAEAAGRTALAAIGAVRFRACAEPEGAATARRTLADCVRGALDAAGVGPENVRAVLPLAGGGPLATQEAAAVRDALGEARPRWTRLRDLVGDTSAAATSLQLAAALAESGDRGLAPGEAALITGVDRDGMVGCAVLTGAGARR
ncbi:beta-ketoacyl synthase N-terminal-like domain-containing protein [Streptomyces olivochromogenes]|uniref:3-oxoacyl-ACP synthase n=1 Tax=Streptomyces olivochromogenes TaxID=1963 RepID=A0A250VCH4_STROL|nr:beta-ketoacyl synthase N-terminal-like domain-containing protein [Streptomyces olivochromogenes]KUN45308.1 3-oxoacyl-ACP synthase [Streptomyces olivochromogenes]GAX51784.1 3-oxoacyl-ACP synthase [Streptomyces olivochromogenes]